MYIYRSILLFREIKPDGIPMGYNCAPLLTSLSLYTYEVEFVQKLLQDKKRSKKPSRVLQPYIQIYIDDFPRLSINNHNFQYYVHLIYPNELKITDTTDSEISASYLDILPKGLLSIILLKF
jgi:hypothetical protein